MPYMADAEWIEVIMKQEDYDETSAENIFESGKTNGWLSRHCGLWGGYLTKKDGPDKRPQTKKEQYYWDMYGAMPPVQHCKVLLESEHIKWLIQFWMDRGVDIDLQSAERERQKVWKFS